MNGVHHPDLQGGGIQGPANQLPADTLLTCNLKIVAKSLTSMFGEPLIAVIDATQTPVLPRIGEDILSHLEEFGADGGSSMFLDIHGLPEGP